MSRASFILMRQKKNRAARVLQRFFRMIAFRFQRRRNFAFILCGKRCAPYRVIKLRHLLACWHELVQTSQQRLKEGIPFFATRTGFAYIDGQCAIHKRVLRVHSDQVVVWTRPEDSSEPPQELQKILMSELKAITQGTKHNKRNVEFRLRNGVVDVYKLSNPWGFLQLFDLQWTKLMKRKAKNLPKPFKPPVKENPFPEQDIPLPSSEDALRAVGNMDDMFPPMRWVYSAHKDKFGLFSPLQEPWKNEWLTLDARHAERQTYEQWKSSIKALPGRTGKSRVYFIAVGEFDDLSGDPRVDTLAEFAKAYFFGLKVEMLPPLRLKGESCSLMHDEILIVTRRIGYYQTFGRQAHIDLRLEKRERSSTSSLCGRDVLKILRYFRPQDAYAVIGITMHDVSIDDMHTKGCCFTTTPAYVNRLRENRIALISLARVDPAFDIDRYETYIKVPADERKTSLLRRSCVLVAQHLMVLFGMELCLWHSCVMNGFITAEEVVRVPLQACPVCLRKLQDALRIKTVLRTIERLKALRIFCHIHQRTFEREVRWYGTRCKLIDDHYVTYAAGSGSGSLPDHSTQHNNADET